jgi:hypothetical protein
MPQQFQAMFSCLPTSKPPFLITTTNRHFILVSFHRGFDGSPAVFNTRDDKIKKAWKGSGYVEVAAGTWGDAKNAHRD